MKHAIVLSGGTGTRLGRDIPKQYIEVGGMPVIMYCLITLQNADCIDSICIVASGQWQDFLLDWLKRLDIDKFAGFAPAGESRQHSIKNGLDFLEKNGAKQEDIVLIHDAARPMLRVSLVERCIDACSSSDAVLPVIPVKDTVYMSEDGKTITGLLNRDQLFAGQAPEAFSFGKYFGIHKDLSIEELGMIRGSSEIAHKNGFKIAMVEGDEGNYKITTEADLEKFVAQCNMANGE